jgi:hypothetical protein
VTEQRKQTRARWTDQEAERQSDDRSRRLLTIDLENQWIHFLSHPNVQHSLNLRVELTLKQRRATELETRRPAETVTARYPHFYTRRLTHVDAINGTYPVKRFVEPVLDDKKTVNVRVAPSRLSLRDAPLYAPFYYLTRKIHEDRYRRNTNAPAVVKSR